MPKFLIDLKVLKRGNVLAAGVVTGLITAVALNFPPKAAAPNHGFIKLKKEPASVFKENGIQDDQTAAISTPKVLSQDKTTVTNARQVLIWEQDFTAVADRQPTKTDWNIANSSLPIYNNERQVYSDQLENVRIENKVLVLEARRQGNTYTSGRIDTLNRKEVEINSRLEARMKLPKGKGTWPAFWLLSANQPHTAKLKPSEPDWQQPRFYLRDGEIDIMEAYGRYPGTIEATAHAFAATKEGTYKLPNASEAFHTYWLEWKIDKLIFGVDNQAYFTHQKTSNSLEEWPFTADNKYYLILNLAMGGSGSGDIVQATGDYWRFEIASIKYYKLPD